MNLIRTLSLSILFLCGLSTATAVLANAGSAEKAEMAAADFQHGDYKSAYKNYVKLAKDGDAFAQYRVSYMELMGLGTKPDVVDAMAWAVLAAESGHQELVRYQDAVSTLVPSKSRKKAQARADYFLRRWGREDRTSGGQMARKSEGVCTGSRLAGNCGQGSDGSGIWIAWGEDRSGDPEQKGRIEDLNDSILQQASDIRNQASES
jgi:TPR repeat protein